MSLFDYDQHILEIINHNRVEGLDQVLIVITNTVYLTAILVCGFLFFYSYIKNDSLLKLKAWQVAASLAFNSIVVTVLKYSINRQRPFIMDKSIEKLSGGGSPSFPSGHTSDAFLLATCLSILFSNNRWLLLCLWLWALLVAYTRLALGVHYPSDVIGAMVIGISNAFIINWIFLKRFTKLANYAGADL